MVKIKRNDVMTKIDEQIQWYEQNATRKDEDLIKADLKLINNLYDEVENSEDKIFLDKIVGTFCEIVEIQRNVINSLLTDAEQGVSCASVSQNNRTCQGDRQDRTP